MKMSSAQRKYLELWERFSIQDDFEPFVGELKENFKTQLQPKWKWSREESIKWEDAVYDILFALMPKYMHPEGNFLYTALEIYAIYGERQVKEYISEGPSYTLGINVYDELPRHFLDRYKDGVFIYIPPYISKKNLEETINEKWPEISKLFSKKNQDHTNYPKLKNLKSHKSWERDRLVYNLYNQTRSQLGLRRGDLKEIRVSALLKQDYGITLEPENVKIIASRQRKLRKGNT